MIYLKKDKEIVAKKIVYSSIIKGLLKRELKKLMNNYKNFIKTIKITKECQIALKLINSQLLK